MASPTPTLETAFAPGCVPDLLKRAARWAPWRAKWNEKRGKWDKVPCYPRAPFHGLSTAKVDRWGGFDAAVAAYQAHPERFAGVGYVMTGPHGLVGVDLDACVAAGAVAPWAQEIVDALASYTEVSPSGRGLRVFVQADAAEVADDWTNHEVGIEVYAGHEPRFLTVTGQHLPGTPAEVRQGPPGVLPGLAQRYARERSAPAGVTSLVLPDIVDELLLPDVAGLGLPYTAVDFLVDGTTRGDRSRELFAAAVALHQAGLDEAGVFNVLAASPHAFEVALDHRRQDHDRALMYLWVEHAQKAKGRGGSRVATADDFDVVGDGKPAPTSTMPDGAAGHSAPPHAARPRFAFTAGEEFFDPAHPPTRWLFKRLLPERGLAMVFGPSTAGKTFFVLDIAMHLALGRDWRDRRVSGAGVVAYICAEGGEGFRKRGQAWLQHHGVERQGLPLHLLADAPNLLEKGDVKDLIAALRRIEGLRLVVVDTLAQTTPGANENTSEDMGRAMAHCQRIVAATGATVLLVGHTGKDEDRGHRGWSGMPAAFDASIQLERSGELRAATIVKLKDGEGEGDEFPFHLNGVVLGEDEDGDAITSCVALPGNKAGARAAPPALGPLQRVVYDTAVNMLELDSNLTVDELCAAVVAHHPKPTGRSDNRKRNAEREFKALVRKNLLVEIGDRVWLPESNAQEIANG